MAARLAPMLAALGLGLWFSMVAPASAMDLAEVWQLAVQRDAVFAAVRYGRDADQEKLPQARAQLLPHLSANAGAQVDNTRRMRGLSSHSTTQRAVWSLTLSQPIFDMRAWDALEQAQYLSNSADVGQARALQDLILRVTEAYFDILIAQDSLRSLRAEKLAVEDQLTAARQSFELGSTTITDTYEAESRLDLLNANELELTNQLQISRDRLASIIASPPGTLNELPAKAVLPGPQPSQLERWLEQASTANLSVVQAALQMKITEKSRDMAKSERLPRLQLQAQTGSASDRGIYGSTGDRGPRSLDSSVGLFLSIPLYTGGEISSHIREESLRLQQRRHEMEAARRTARQFVEQYFSGVTSGLARIKALEAAEKSSLASLQANQLAYEVGVRINIDVLNAQRQLYETQRLLSLARYTTLMNSLRLKAASGMLAETDLLAVNELLSAPITSP